MTNKRDILKKLGNIIKLNRRKLGLSQEQFAHRVGLHRTYIGAIERGERNLTILRVFELACTLNMQIKDLFERIT